MIRSFSSKPRRSLQRNPARSSSDSFFIEDASSLCCAANLLYGAASHHFLDFADCVRWVQALRTDIGAIHDCVATEQPVRIFQVVESLGGGFVARIGDESVCLQQPGGTAELVGIPPERRPRSRTAGAYNTFEQAVELLTRLGRLQALGRAHDRTHVPETDLVCSISL